MLTRYAIFEGKLRDGMKEAMQTYVNKTLIPLWRQFTGAETVSVLFEAEKDSNGPTIPLVLAISYPNEEAMHTALNSPARYEARDLLPGFYEAYFETVNLYHYVMDTQVFSAHRAND